MKKISAWLSALRLRTLPLALSCIILGSSLAHLFHFFRTDVFVWACLTTVFLQILSNLANDYGDSVHGADSKERTGPSRAVQSGKISLMEMKYAIVICAFFSFLSGLYLLYISLDSLIEFLALFALGIVSILAAIKYTAGKSPYGYAGFGDISVFLFFGFLGVGGAYYLHSGVFDFGILLPAASCGFFSVAVLNINNIRDIKSDELAGKKTIPVRIGVKNAKIYHWGLLISGFITMIFFNLIYYKSIWQFLFVICLPILILNGLKVWKSNDNISMDANLKPMALFTFFFSLIFSLGVVLAHVSF